ncbi:hypothetical protein [Acidipropionibacterium jensenii]|uniref:hypothetical protein n=1 Tax=Acidipropionibacterium jensenii TaxID=1749 RepID=UPI00214C9624|nr:hypothetical protein [Acidipropionibacterium jensenii]
MTATLSLADIARLARVQRPVVSMWRQRAVQDAPFPAPQPDGRFNARDVLSYLSATGRGNNPDPQLTSDLAVAASPATDPADRAELLALLAARAVLGTDPIADTDIEDLLDDVEALDPDDEWLFSEIEDADIDRLAPQADAIADNAYSTAEAYEELRSRTAPGGLATDLITTLADIAAALLGENGTLVDVGATASDIALALTADESRADTRMLVATASTATHDTAARTRTCLRRYRVHGRAAQITDVQGDWNLTDGSVILARIVSQDEGATAFADAMATIDELTLHMGPSTTALVIGPASHLIDELPAGQVGLRDAFLRDGLVRAAVRLPRGLLSEGGGEHLALWLMGPGDPRHLWAGDLSGIGFGESTRQQLLDDVVAAARASHHGRRAFALLHRTDTTRLLARSLPLTALDVSPTDPFPVSAADDAARMADLLRELAAPMTDPFGDVRPQATGSGSAGSSTLGDLARNRLIQVLPGHRFEPLPPGQQRMWTAETVASRRPDAVDLMTLTARHPDVALTRPGDVVFTSAGSPHAVVDAEGGSAVAEPARVLRISPTASLSARAIASAINALAPIPGKGRWRSWTVPVVTGSRSDAEEALARVDSWEDQIRTRLDLLDELRRLATRSVTSGAVSFVDTHANPRDGKASDGS